MQSGDPKRWQLTVSTPNSPFEYFTRSFATPGRMSSLRPIASQLRTGGKTPGAAGHIVRTPIPHVRESSGTSDRDLRSILSERRCVPARRNAGRKYVDNVPADFSATLIGQSLSRGTEGSCNADKCRHLKSPPSSDFFLCHVILPANCDKVGRCSSQPPFRSRK